MFTILHDIWQYFVRTWMATGPLFAVAGIALVVSVPLAAPAASASETPRINAPAASPQGLLEVSQRPGRTVSPLGTTLLTVDGAAVAEERWISSISVVTKGQRFELADLPGNGFLASDVSRVVAIEAADAASIPTAVRVFDLDGRLRYEQAFAGLVQPALSSDGGALVFRHRAGILLLDLISLRAERFPHLQVFAAGPAGALAGVIGGELVIFDGSAETQARLSLPPDCGRPQRLAFCPPGPRVLLLTGEVLYGLDPAKSSWQRLYTAPDQARLRDLAVRGRSIDLGVRRIEFGVARGERVTLDGGRVLERVDGEDRVLPHGNAFVGPENPPDPIPWPVEPNSQHPVGNTYGEYQRYGGTAYMHPGVDVMTEPNQPVYAVRGGVVKAVLTTSGELHWRVAIADQASPATTPGYLYAHLVESSIAFDVGEVLQAGDYLGDIVSWSVDDFHHVHFARIEDQGETWNGSWLCIGNPHPDFPNQTELDVPFFETVSGELLAFCDNETSDYQDPQALQAAVDIIAHVGDRIETDWVCAVQEIRYTIYPAGSPDLPVVDNKLAVDFDMVLDTYAGGPVDPFLVGLLYKQDDVCPTEGNYDTREFYHVITNSNGDSVYEESDRWEAWDTTSIPDGEYVIQVRIKDVAGNTAEDSMLVSVANYLSP